jgi:hypothetical protein
MDFLQFFSELTLPQRVMSPQTIAGAPGGRAYSFTHGAIRGSWAMGIGWNSSFGR